MTSVTCAAPPGQPPDQEAVEVPNATVARLGARAQARRRCRAASELGRREVRVEHQARSARARAARARPPSARRRASAVRRSCQTMALRRAGRSARSQSSVVSRWLVMPMAAIRARRRRPRSASPSAPSHRAPRSPPDRARPRPAAGRSAGTRGSRAPARCAPRRAPARSCRWSLDRWRGSGLARRWQNSTLSLPRGPRYAAAVRRPGVLREEARSTAR